MNITESYKEILEEIGRLETHIYNMVGQVAEKLGISPIENDDEEFTATANQFAAISSLMYLNVQLPIIKEMLVAADPQILEYIDNLMSEEEK